MNKNSKEKQGFDGTKPNWNTLPKNKYIPRHISSRNGPNCFKVLCKIPFAVKINREKHLLIAKTAANTVNSRHFYGSVAWKPKNALRWDVRLNDVNWSLVTTSLLGNSGYQTNRPKQDHLAISCTWEPRAMQIPTDLLTSRKLGIKLWYHKIPKISPGAYIFQRPFLRSLFLEGLYIPKGLIYGGKFAFQNRLG